VTSVDEEYVEAVLDVVEAIPAGRVMTYGDVATVVGRRLARGGPRQVGTALREVGAAVPWWRVVRSSGLPAVHKEETASALLRVEGCPFVDGERVDMRRARLAP